MPGATPLYGLPYPIAADRLDAAVTTIPQSLATQVESTIAGFGGIAAPGAWETVGAAGKAAFAAGWGAFGAPWQVPQYRKVASRVWIRGIFKNTTGANSASPSTLLTLPVGYRPVADNNWPADSQGVYRQITITSAGVVKVLQAVAAGADLAVNLQFWID